MRYNKAIILFTSITIILVILGFSLLLVSSIRVKNYFEKYTIYEITEGEIINYIKKDNNTKAIVVEYKVNQESYLLESKRFHRHPEEIGTPIKVAYNVDNPSESIWMPLNENNTINYFLIVLSLLIIVSSFIIGIFNYKLIKNNSLIEYVKQENGFYNDKSIVKELEEYEASI